MPSFDALAGASLTPGGVQSGVNDLVSALVNGPIKRRQIEMQQAQMAQENDFKNRSFGEQVASRIDKNRGDDAQLGETTRHNKAEEEIGRGAFGLKQTEDQAKKQKMAEDRALAKMGGGFTGKGKKLMPRKTYIAGIPTNENPSGIQGFDNGYDEGPWSPQDNDRFNQLYAQEMNASGGVADIADKLGQPAGSANPGAALPRAAQPHAPTPTMPARSSVNDLVPGGMMPAPAVQSQPAQAPMPSAAPTAAAPGAGAAKTASRQQLAQIAAKNGRSLDEAVALYQKNGYTITE